MSNARLHRVGGWVAGAALLIIGLGTFASEPARPGLTISQPQALSIQGESRVSFLASAPFDQTLVARFDLVSEDGFVSEPVFDAVVSLGSSPREFSFAVTPAHLAPFAVGEAVVLMGHVGASLTEGELPLTASAPETSGWTLNVPATAVVFSTQDSQLTFRTVNPKNNPLPVNLKLKFRNLKGKVVASWKYPIIALPGESVHSVTVPLSVCNQAKLKGANSLKTLLLKDGDTKAQGQSLLDWDLVVSTSADRSQGTAPLTVSFTALVSGGVAPYAFDWDYADGTVHGDSQNPNHTFLHDGVYSVVLRVVDSRGGIVTAAPVVIAVQ